ncbi:unnamed protein product [Rotaria socialis]|uniref:N-acetylmuramoyl-L-alanine amidase domain-containing protein n=1 Tax=Rotaria socialis TaxID=392032 RepID=A0A817NG97_9BILA|nr:unnamed protein product [Rotaria socialis]CAF3362944.1 unnamed protein product [Rotaria socialis]CAF4284589.1 unnamed protein product [Rotaria socialis]CAF4419161.1 unnamed protein product [Rotaria socialis]CAF4730666.1 unnamed protein product [Rotaria socialis]
MQQYRHGNYFGWDDIGYHFVIGENGKVYEGRGRNNDTHGKKTILSIIYTDNVFHLSGVCIIGDFRKASPNEKALNALRSLVDCGVKQG